MRLRRPLFDDHPVEPLERLTILIVGQYQLNRRTILEFRVDRKCQTHFIEPSPSKDLAYLPFN